MLLPQTGQIVAIKKIHLGQAKEVLPCMHAAQMHSTRQCFTSSDMPCLNMYRREPRLALKGWHAIPWAGHQHDGAARDQAAARAGA